MATIVRAQSYLRSNPDEALTDALGCMALCAMVLAAFTVPALL